MRNDATWEFPSESDPSKRYTVTLNEKGRLSCNCQGWVIKRTGKSRSCKHTKAIIRMEFVEGRGWKVERRDEGEFVLFDASIGVVKVVTVAFGELKL